MKKYFKIIICLFLFIVLITFGWYVFLSNKSMKQIPKRAKFVFNENIDNNGVVNYKKC
ncbi:hypothetical protein [Caloranaerobacter azorensis]|uniref:Uncharacterized protein n=2 Tax=Caloranaerobacter azorensis TaxID=116090 RepID=A0A1M5V7H5_9FIRM|nr:hypothetical protein [Caloranaerobacter azorensis]QIB26577.1 hypothetical protein G3A45_04195 [Caloranaerobacter azorensis]SHH71175.1 hypothetical protein SAMN02745135_01787 [Caloranaerobacter azorensis DSM 13643]